MPEDVYLKSIYLFPEQFRQAWEESMSLEIPDEYKNVNDVIIAGMGGSLFGGLIVKAVFNSTQGSSDLLVPVSLCPQYDLPDYADEKTLVIASSYSGNTEEVLSVFEQAIERGCKVITISSGGILAKKAKEQKLLNYTFVPKFNVARQTPRTGIGYSIGAALGILSNLGLLNFSKEKAVKVYRETSNFLSLMREEDRLPIQVSQKILGKIPIFICAEHLSSGAHIWRNFLNETAKHFSFISEIPDMNHHFLDGLLFPKRANNNFIMVYLNSTLYHARVKKRFKITRSITKKADLADISITLGGRDKLSELFELILIGCVVSFNLSRIHGANPATNEMVDLLKSELDK